MQKLERQLSFTWNFYLHKKTFLFKSMYDLLFFFDSLIQNLFAIPFLILVTMLTKEATKHFIANTILD